MKPLDLDLTLGCGQTFRWRSMADGSWKGIVNRDAFVLRSSARHLSVEAYSGDHGAKSRLLKYLRASDDLKAIHAKLSEDEVIARGISQVDGLRLVRIPSWECIVSYVIATNSNVKRISRMVDAVATSFGDIVYEELYSFPSWEQLRDASFEELVGCGLGYRAKHIHALCRTIDDGAINRMGTLPHEELRRELKELPGIGDKVADCVSLFGFGHLEAFPIDVWVERALRRLYGATGSYAKLRAFAARRFGEYAGYAQEYLYHNERRLHKDGRCAFSQV